MNAHGVETGAQMLGVVPRARLPEVERPGQALLRPDVAQELLTERELAPQREQAVLEPLLHLCDAGLAAVGAIPEAVHVARCVQLQRVRQRVVDDPLQPLARGRELRCHRRLQGRVQALHAPYKAGAQRVLGAGDPREHAELAARGGKVAQAVARVDERTENLDALPVRLVPVGQRALDVEKRLAQRGAQARVSGLFPAGRARPPVRRRRGRRRPVG